MFSPSIFIIGVLLILIVIVAWKRLFRKKRSGSDVNYTPFDYITGQTDKEFHVNQEEEEKKNK